MRRFVIGAEGLDKAAEAKMVAYFRERNLGWWHHIQNFWLIYDRFDSISAEELRDKVTSFRPSGNPLLVIEIDNPKAWSGRRPNSNQAMFDWLKNKWNEG